MVLQYYYAEFYIEFNQHFYSVTYHFKWHFQARQSSPSVNYTATSLVTEPNSRAQYTQFSGDTNAAILETTGDFSPWL